MSFASVAEFVAMGGHGLYVWLCYGASVLVVMGNVLLVRRQQVRMLRDLADRQLRQRD